VAGTDPEECGSEVTNPSVPFAWSLDELDGLAAVSFGVLGQDGGFQLMRLEDASSTPGVASALLDADSDGLADARDNCLELANADQVDADRDGFGNACDADVDGDGLVGVPDWLRFARALGAVGGETGFDPRLDLDGDGAVATEELLSLGDALGGPPGPSGLACAGQTPCP
jgi:hypothetical protein